MMEKTRGFLTIATGSEKYYALAVNLLRSYRMKCTAEKPEAFAVITDANNPYIGEFDRAIILDKPSNSYLDKLRLDEDLPFDENIFIDADSLAFGDLSPLFDAFSNAGDFSAFGRALPVDTKEGVWFDAEGAGEYRDKIQFTVNMHGGVYYIRRTPLAHEVFALARHVCENFHSFAFAALKQATPTDEVGLALAMAVTGCKPTDVTTTPKKSPYLLFLPSVQESRRNRIALDFPKGIAHIQMGDWDCDVLLVHFQTNFTVDGLYQSQLYLMNCLREKKDAPLSAEEEKRMYGEARRIFLSREPRRIARRVYFFARHSILGGVKRALLSVVRK